MNEKLRTSEKEKEWTKERVKKLSDDLLDLSGHVDIDEEYLNAVATVRQRLQDNLDRFQAEQENHTSNWKNSRESFWDKFNRKKKREKEIRLKEEFEAIYTLGCLEDNQASDVSYTKWQVFHPKKNPNIRFVEIGNVMTWAFTNDGLRWFINKNGADIPNKKEDDSFISVSKYIDSHAKPRIRFGIVISKPDLNKEEVIDTRIKRDGPSDTIETEIVEFRNVETGYVKYLKIKISGHQNAITTTRMKPKEIGK